MSFLDAYQGLLFLCKDARTGPYFYHFIVLLFYHFIFLFSDWYIFATCRHVQKHTMPWFRLRRARRYTVSSKNSYVVCVNLLDNTLIECTLTADSTGQECLENIAQRIELNQVCMSWCSKNASTLFVLLCFCGMFVFALTCEYTLCGGTRIWDNYKSVGVKCLFKFHLNSHFCSLRG